MVWSAPFDLEKMEDLQIKFLSKETPAEKKLNVFQKQWFFPRGASQTRFARVFIYTQDEATIHIAFLDPKDPDFKIFNKTEDVFTIRQKVSSESYLIIPFKHVGNVVNVMIEHFMNCIIYAGIIAQQINRGAPVIMNIGI